MKHTKQKQNQNSIWVVATNDDIKAARKRGLFKMIISMADRETFKLSPNHIRDLTSLVTEEIERQVFEYHQSGGECLDLPQENLMKIEELLYMLEDLFLAHPTINSEKLYKKLSLVRKLVAFPKLVESLFTAYEDVEAEHHKKTDICVICCKKEADIHFTNIAAHENCLIEKKWYVCKECGWIYPTNKERCDRTYQCSDKTLIKFQSDYDQPF